MHRLHFQRRNDVSAQVLKLKITENKLLTTSIEIKRTHF